MNDEVPNSEAKMDTATGMNYVEIIKSDLAVDKKYTDEMGLPAKILYYCRDCKKLVTPKRIGKKLSFRCGECDKDQVSFGTESSIRNFYNIKQ